MTQNCPNLESFAVQSSFCITVSQLNQFLGSINSNMLKCLMLGRCTEIDDENEDILKDRARRFTESPSDVAPLKIYVNNTGVCQNYQK